MSGGYPVWMQPEVDEALHMDHTVTPRDGARDARGPSRRQGRLRREPDVLRRRRRPRRHRGGRARVRRAVARRRGLGPALPFSSGAAANRRWKPAPTCASTRRTRCSARSRRRRCCTCKAARIRLDRLQGGLQAVSLDLAEPGARRVARRRAPSDGARRSGAALAHDRDRERTPPPAQRDSRACTASAKSSKGGPACSTSIRPRSRLRSSVSATPATKPKRFCAAATTCSASWPTSSTALALFTIGTTPDAADELVYGVRELAREDRPVDIFSPSGDARARLKTGTYKLPRIPPIAHPAARSVPGDDRIRPVQDEAPAAFAPR